MEYSALETAECCKERVAWHGEECRRVDSGTLRQRVDVMNA
jgi:hypothetical protein